MMPKEKKIQIMDTTLRDGEQTKDVSFNSSEKLAMARLLLKRLTVDFIEVASARVSEGELEAVKEITKWAKSENCLDKICLTRLKYSVLLTEISPLTG